MKKISERAKILQTGYNGDITSIIAYNESGNNTIPNRKISVLQTGGICNEIFVFCCNQRGTGTCFETYGIIRGQTPANLGNQICLWEAGCTCIHYGGGYCHQTSCSAY